MVYVYLMEQQTWESIPDQFTSDGVKIVPGLAVWDYDYNLNAVKNEVVAPSPYPDASGVVWFQMKNNRKNFDGSRLSVRRPW